MYYAKNDKNHKGGKAQSCTIDIFCAGETRANNLR